MTNMCTTSMAVKIVAILFRYCRSWVVLLSSTTHPGSFAYLWPTSKKYSRTICWGLLRECCNMFDTAFFFPLCPRINRVSAFSLARLVLRGPTVHAASGWTRTLNLSSWFAVYILQVTAPGLQCTSCSSRTRKFSSWFAVYVLQLTAKKVRMRDPTRKVQMRSRATTRKVQMRSRGTTRKCTCGLETPL